MIAGNSSGPDHGDRRKKNVYVDTYWVDYMVSGGDPNMVEQLSGRHRVNVVIGRLRKKFQMSAQVCLEKQYVGSVGDATQDQAKAQ